MKIRLSGWGCFTFAALLPGCGAPERTESEASEPEVAEIQQPALSVTTTHQCDVVGLGSRRGETGHPQHNKRNIAHNFRGVTQAWLDGGNLYDPLLKAEYRPTVAGTFSPPAGDAVFGAGGHEYYAPIILGTDLGYSIELKSSPGQQGILALMFGDTRIAPVLGRSTEMMRTAVRLTSAPPRRAELSRRRVEFLERCPRTRKSRRSLEDVALRRVEVPTVEFTRGSVGSISH
jgi:hypothetical protein